MKNPYYMIWADALWASKRKKVSIFLPFFGIILAQYTNISTLWVILNKLGIEFSIIPEFHYFNDEDHNILFKFLIFVVLPLAIVNYLLVFWRGKKLLIMQKYKGKRAKLFLTYVSVSLAIFLLLIVFGMVFLGW